MVDKQERNRLLEAWIGMLNCVAHDVSTPLSAIRAQNNQFKKMLPQLLEVYELAVQHKLIEPQIKPSSLSTLENASEGIENQVDRILDFFKVLRQYNKQLPANESDLPIPLATCLHTVLEHYPFSDEQRQWIHLEGNVHVQLKEYSFLIEHLFVNLLQIALSHIEQMGKGEIYIRIEEEADCFMLYFKNTAGAQDEAGAGRAFNWYFVKYNGNTIPGLGFCRLKLLHRRGDITCAALKGEYTEFRVRFPKT